MDKCGFTFSEMKKVLYALYENNYTEYSSKRKLRNWKNPFKGQWIAKKVYEGNKYIHSDHGIANLEQAAFKYLK